MEGKISVETDEFWLKAEVKEDTLKLSIVIFQNQQVKTKLCRDVSIRKDLKDLRALKNCEQLMRMFINPNNYQIKADEKVLNLRWAISGDGFNFDIISQLKMNEQKLSQTEALTCQNIFLKNQLKKFKQAQLQNHQSSMQEQKTIANLSILPQSGSNSVGRQNNLITNKSQDLQKSMQKIQQKQQQKPNNANKKQKGSKKMNSSVAYDSPSPSQKVRKNKPIHKTKIREKEKEIQKNRKLSRNSESNQVSDISRSEQNQKKQRKRKSNHTEPKKNTDQIFSAIEENEESKDKNVRVDMGGGDYYYGQMKDGKFHGYGVLQSHTHGRHQGNWVNGAADGRGVHFDVLGNKYEGQYKNDKRNGYGIEIYINGEKYEGNFADDVKCGFGKYYYSDGDMYEGEWAHDVYNGKGKETYANGSIYEGLFKDDQKNEWGIFMNKNGKKFKQFWEMGKLRKEQVFIDEQK